MALRVGARYPPRVTRRLFRFDSCRIDLATRELHRGGELVALSPRIFDCIAWLIEHRDRAVGRDELAAAVWGKADVTDAQLVQAILKARRAIGDTGEEQRAIRTIPRFGYRWVADVDVPVPDDVPVIVPLPAAATDEAVAPATRSASRRRPFAVLAFAAVVVAAIAAWPLLRSERAAPADAGAPAAQTAIAVLPAMVSAERDWSWMRLGMMDLVADRLHQAGLTVVPSANIVSLLREQGEGTAAEAAVRDAVAPQWMIVPTVRRTASGWIASLEVQGPGGNVRVVEADAQDPVVAVRQAVGQTLPLFGRIDAPDGSAVDDVVARVRAALLRGDFVAAQGLIDSAAPAQRATADVQLLQGQAEFGLGRFEDARDRFASVLGELGEQADPFLRARALKGRAASQFRLSRLKEAEDDYEAALALLHGRDDPALEGALYSGRGATRAQRGGNDAGAMADFARARIALRLAGDTLGLAGVEMNEGALKGRRGRPVDALASFRAAERHFARFDSRTELAAALANQIEAHLALLEPARALEVGERGLSLMPRLEDPSARRLLEYWRACALAAVGRLTEARTILEALNHAPDASQDAAMLSMSQGRTAMLALAAGESESAVALARQSLANAAGSPWNDARGESWLTLVRALRSIGDDAGAQSEVERFSGWARGLSDPAVDIMVRLVQAEQAWGARDGESASQAYSTALALADRFTVPADIARVAVSWGSTLIAGGELDAAAAVVGRLERWSSTDFACALLQAKLYRALGQDAAWRDASRQVRLLAGERTVPAAAVAESGDDGPLAGR